MTYYVYAIGHKKCLVEPYNNCYIGVTKNLFRRWKNHLRSSYTVGYFIRDNLLVYEENMVVIFQGTKEDCFAVEEKYRPIPFLGLNEASGGRGGYTIYTQERNNIISKKVKESRKNKKWTTHQTRKSYSGENNPHAKKWILIDKQENMHYVTGNLASFCKENKLLQSCLRKYTGDKVPEPNYNGYGGYRVKNETSKMLRENTVGWTLIEANSLPGGVS